MIALNLLKPDELKWCNKCRSLKPSADFGRRSDRPIGRQASCRACQATHTVDFRNANRAHFNTIRRACYGRNPGKWWSDRLKSEYGLTVADYARMLEAQGGVCGICGGKEESKRYKHLSVDHDHATGRVRGLLCNNCNRALGLLKDSTIILLAAARYLKAGRG